MERKASLQLSINAIVVLILAITLLGLGLAFITERFGGTMEKLQEIDQETEQQIIDEMKNSGQLVTLNQREFEVESGKPIEFYMGIRNTESNDVTYYIQFMCDQKLSTGSCQNVAADFSQADEFYNNGGGDGQWRWFKTFKKIPIDSGEGKAVIVRLQASGATETYKGRVAVWKCTRSDQSACEDPVFPGEADFGSNPPQATDGTNENTNPVATERITLKVI